MTSRSTSRSRLPTRKALSKEASWRFLIATAIHSNTYIYYVSSSKISTIAINIALRTHLPPGSILPNTRQVCVPGLVRR